MQLARKKAIQFYQPAAEHQIIKLHWATIKPEKLFSQAVRVQNTQSASIETESSLESTLSSRCFWRPAMKAHIAFNHNTTTSPTGN